MVRKNPETESRLADLSDLISQAEAARLRNVSRAAIGNLVANGKLSFRDVLGRKFVYKTEVLSFEPGKPGPKATTAQMKRNPRTGTKSRKGKKK